MNGNNPQFSTSDPGLNKLSFLFDIAQAEFDKEIRLNSQRYIEELIESHQSEFSNFSKSNPSTSSSSSSLTATTTTSTLPLSTKTNQQNQNLFLEDEHQIQQQHSIQQQRHYQPQQQQQQIETPELYPSNAEFWYFESSHKDNQQDNTLFRPNHSNVQDDNYSKISNPSSTITVTPSSIRKRKEISSSSSTSNVNNPNFKFSNIDTIQSNQTNEWDSFHKRAKLQDTDNYSSPSVSDSISSID